MRTIEMDDKASVFVRRKGGRATSIPCVVGGGGGANTKVPDMYGVGGVFSGPKTQK